MAVPDDLEEDDQYEDQDIHEDDIRFSITLREYQDCESSRDLEVEVHHSTRSHQGAHNLTSTSHGQAAVAGNHDYPTTDDAYQRMLKSSESCLEEPSAQGNWSNKGMDYNLDKPPDEVAYAAASAAGVGTDHSIQQVVFYSGHVGQESCLFCNKRVRALHGNVDSPQEHLERFPKCKLREVLASNRKAASSKVSSGKT